MVLRSRFHLCDANIFGGARAARNGGARGTGVRGALLEAVGVLDTAAHGLFWEPREVSCFFACAAGASRGAAQKASTAPRRVICVHSRCDSFRRATSPSTRSYPENSVVDDRWGACSCCSWSRPRGPSGCRRGRRYPVPSTARQTPHTRRSHAAREAYAASSKLAGTWTGVICYERAPPA